MKAFRCGCAAVIHREDCPVEAREEIEVVPATSEAVVWICPICFGPVPLDECRGRNNSHPPAKGVPYVPALLDHVSREAE